MNMVHVLRKADRVSRSVWEHPPKTSVVPAKQAQRFFLWRFALIRLRYLCLLIFLRRFFISEPMTSLFDRNTQLLPEKPAGANRIPHPEGLRAVLIGAEGRASDPTIPGDSNCGNVTPYP